MADGLPGELPGFLSPAGPPELALGNEGELCFGFLHLFTLLALHQMVQHNAGEGGRGWKQKLSMCFISLCVKNQEKIVSKE